MNVIGSVIARSGSKRLPYKNLLPYKGVPLVRLAVEKLLQSDVFSRVILSTDSELIARTCMDMAGLSILKRPSALAGDQVASIPVFQHIVEHFPCDMHLNYNCNFPECPASVFTQAISEAVDCGESLSDPYAVWARTKQCLSNYGDPFQIKAKKFAVPEMYPLDIHTEQDLLETHQFHQKNLDW